MKNLRILTAITISVLMGVAAAVAQDRDSGVALSVRAPISARIALLENYDLLALRRVYFNSGAVRPKESQLASLGPVLTQAAHFSGSIIELRAYADRAASSAEDVKISEQRADAVARFLKSQGIASDRIVVVAVGEVDPTGPAFQAEHQRVDIRLFAPPRVDGSAGDSRR